MSRQPTDTLRRLPRGVSPALDESLDSYVTRLAVANYVGPRWLRAHLAGDHHAGAPVPAAALAQVSGQPEHAQRRAILELSTPEERAALGLVGRPHRGAAADSRASDVRGPAATP